MAAAADYRGRFAPSPTGPLHLGSLVAALASFLDARQHGGQWLLRIEDIDPPRESPGASARIQNSLTRHGLHWDGDVLFQSTRLDAYRETLRALDSRGLIFPCVCTRAVLGPGGSCGGRCSPSGEAAHALRLRLPSRLPAFEDLLCGLQTPVEERRDVVLWRKDGLPAYALAVTVDDCAQGISHVIRGADLLGETALQRHLMAQFSKSVPSYGHVPVVRGPDGRKLSKQNGAAALDDERPLDNLRLALQMLGQDCVEAPARSPEQLLCIAVDAWQPQVLRARTALATQGTDT